MPTSYRDLKTENLKMAAAQVAPNTEGPQLTPVQREHLNGIVRFLGKELKPAPSQPGDEPGQQRFTVAGMPNARVATQIYNGKFTATILEIETGKRVVKHGAYHDADDPCRHYTEHFHDSTDGNGPTTSSGITNGVGRPIMDADPAEYRPPSRHEMQFHNLTSPKNANAAKCNIAAAPTEAFTI